jgi:hypothetical protein
MRAFAIFIITALQAVPGPAGAAETLGVLAVAPPPGPGPELVEATGQLRQVMAVRNPGEVLDARRLRDRMTGETGGASLAELDRAFEGARSAAVSGDYEGSVKALRAIIEELDKLPDGDEALQQWTRALLRLAKTEADLGRADASRSILDRLVRAAPETKVDPALYPPKFARQVEEARAQQQALPRHKLTVTSPAKGVRVHVNGRDVGAAPVSLTLARGRHRVSGAIGALRTPPLMVDLAGEDQTAVLDFTVPEALRPALGPGLALPEADRARRIVAAGGFLGLDSVLATTMVEEGGVSFLLGSLLDVRRGMLRREGRVRLATNRSLPAGGANALADFLATGQQTTLVEVPGAKPVPLPPPPATPKVDLGPRPVSGKSKALGWTALGTGVAAVGLGGVALWQGLAARGARDDARKMLGPDGSLPAGSDSSLYNQKIKDGDSASRIAMGTGIGAGACLLTAGILGYLSYKQTGEIGPFRF